MKIAYKLRFVPMIIGIYATFICLIRFGGASLPYQDPTPELYQQYYHEVRSAQLWLTVSAITTILAIVYYFVIKAKYNKKIASCNPSFRR